MYISSFCLQAGWQKLNFLLVVSLPWGGCRLSHPLCDQGIRCLMTWPLIAHFSDDSQLLHICNNICNLASWVPIVHSIVCWKAARLFTMNISLVSCPAGIQSLVLNLMSISDSFLSGLSITAPAISSFSYHDTALQVPWRTTAELASIFFILAASWITGTRLLLLQFWGAP